MAEVSRVIELEQEPLVLDTIRSLACNYHYSIQKEMVKGYQEMAEINLGLSEMCFQVESEVEHFFEQQIAECE